MKIRKNDLVKNDPIFSKFKFHCDPKFARHPKLPDEPCYRLIICHALFEYYKNNDWKDDSLKDKLAELAGCYSLSVSENNCIYYLKEYLEIYKYKFKNSQYGYNLVDKSGGIYPLILYPYPNSSFSGELAKERAKGFRAAIDDVASHKKEKVLLAFKNHKEWDNLQLELNKIFHDEKKEKAA
jgi:hypothetical protein